jgi:hypothetical protein
MGWDKKVCDLPLAGWSRGRSFLDRINRIKRMIRIK